MIRNFGIFAHVDAGKTTLSERILFEAGAIKQTGSVDKGTTHTDNLDVERRRGISVRSSAVQFIWKDIVMHLIDTPGHTDFSSEIERALWALDGAVLVISGVEGVQPQTAFLFASMRARGIPVILFVNKMDREAADLERVMQEIHTRLSPAAARMDDIMGLAEAMGNCDDAWMERFVTEDLPPEMEILSSFQRMAKAGKVYPVLSGSALRGEGATDLLDACIDCLPSPKSSCDEASGIVFALQPDRTLGLGAVVRILDGALYARSEVTMTTVDALDDAPKATGKITQIRDLKGMDTGLLSAGDIGVVYGLSQVRVGHVLGKLSDTLRLRMTARLKKPLFTVQVIPQDMEKMEEVRVCCETLSREDPLLEAHYIRSLREEHLQVMGDIQTEILEETFRERFSLPVTLGDATLMYQETLLQPTEGFVAYTMPKPCWAVLRFWMEPGKRGSGIVFRSEVNVQKIHEHYQHQVAQAIPLALKQGRRGWPVMDVEITLIDGSDHVFHTHPLDFIVATPMAIQDGLQRGGSLLLEPILEMQILAPLSYSGRLSSDVMRMRGTVEHVETQGEDVFLCAYVPAATGWRYAKELASLTSGKGSLVSTLHGYAPAPEDVCAQRAREGVDPLDQSKYILAARNALDAGIFDF